MKDLERRRAGSGPTWLRPRIGRARFPRILAFAALFLATTLSGDQAAGQLTPTEKGDSIHGTAVNSVTHAPIPRALVSSPDNRFATMTDDEGRFEFTFPEPAAGADDQPNLNPNRPVALLARKPGFVRNAEFSAQDLAAKEVTIDLIPEALIVGKVTLPTSEPPDSIFLQIYRRQVVDGAARWVPAGGTQSRSDGEFRFADLPAGTYKVLTRELLDRDPLTFNPQGQLYGYPPAYSQNAPDFSSAGTIQVSAGMTGLANLTLVKQPYYRIHIPVANALPDTGLNVNVNAAGRRGPGFSLGYNNRDQTIEGMLPNGTYTIEASSFGQSAATGLLTFTVNGAGNPLARTRVTIMDARVRQNIQFVVTSDDGLFEFHVPAGKFALQGAKRGFIAAAYNQHDQFSTAIVTGAGIDAENLTLRLSPNAVLTGRVLDEFGEPVRNAQIIVYRENRFSGISRISRFRGATTDDQGEYEVTPLDEGTYFVSAKATPWYAVHPVSAPEGSTNPPVQVDPALDVSYPITYYGDTTETDSATPIPVRGGDRLEADIHLNPTPALHLLFHVAEGGQVAFPQLQRPSFDGMEDVEPGNIQSVSPGVYELTGIAAGRYMVRMPDSSGQLKEPTAVNLTSSQELDGSSGNSTSKVKVTVKGAGAAAGRLQIQIGLRNSKGRAVTSEVDAKREANFTDVVPGKYDVLAGSPNEVYSVERISWDGGATSGRTLNVPAGASLSVSLSLVAGSVTVEGFAKRDGKGVSGAMVVLIPKNPEANHDRFRRDQTDLDGSFSLFNVSPGSYTVIAIENGWDLDWAKPAVLTHYGRHGQALIVRTQAKGTLRLSQPVAVEK